ncbi:CGNR zinc finger domain-containing protein [Pseudonocardia spinosispora]|uniref:CGNR zinc finger domain-containing protein n=1 Tax=Pseudonocardia spinosispora TaxID=103441 RepID=UPI00146FC5A2|nr:ABATE domain-containing protein [Pseudonocardia spinosispora]
MSELVTTKNLRRAGFPFRSGALCLDFVGTIAKRGMGDQELLDSPERLATWLRAAGLPEVLDPISDEQVRTAHALREAIHDLTRATVERQRPSAETVDRINRAALPSPPTATIALDGRTRVPPPPGSVESVMAVVARDAVDLFTGPYGPRIRACQGHDCSLYFVDRSRPGSRRWCTMAACGERASSATYRRRHPRS